MALDVQETPIIKQLAANDRPTREKALSTLQTYLCSGRTFTDNDLLKIWKGLFFCMFHTDRPLPQQRLSKSLALLLLSLPTALFLPFLEAFWTTIIEYWSSIPSLRLDKYLFLIRQYIAHSFIYLAQHVWEEGLVDGWLQLIEERPLSASDGKVPDGLRYHVLDVWMDGLVGVEGWKARNMMRPVENLKNEGRTKVVRKRAADVWEDKRLKEAEEDTEDMNDSEDERDDGEWAGFGD